MCIVCWVGQVVVLGQSSNRWSDGNVHLEESISKGTTGHYPPWKRIQDMFDDTATRPMNEARLVVAFIKAVDE